MMYYIQVYTKAYQWAPIYSFDDLPKQPKVYKRPQPPPSSSDSSEDGNMLDDTELIPMSTQVLREICRGRTADSLPPKLRRFAALEVIDMTYPQRDTQPVATMDPEQGT